MWLAAEIPSTLQAQHPINNDASVKAAQSHAWQKRVKLTSDDKIEKTGTTGRLGVLFFL